MLYFNFLLSSFKKKLFFNLSNLLFNSSIISKDSFSASSKFCILSLNSLIILFKLIVSFPYVFSALFSCSSALI